MQKNVPSLKPDPRGIMDKKIKAVKKATDQKMDALIKMDKKRDKVCDKAMKKGKK